MRVLIVEDDLVAGLLVERMIKACLSSGDETYVAKTMAEAEQYIRDFGQPEIITLDLNLPDSRWKETLKTGIKRLKGDGQTLVLVMSGVSEDGLDKQAILNGADGFLAKGPDFTERGFLGNLSATIQSLYSQPVRYRAYENILKLITERLGKQ